jgi:adenosine deaminase
MCGHTRSQEYTRMSETFGWEAADFYRCNRNALEAAFIADDEREKLLARLTEAENLPEV